MTVCIYKDNKLVCDTLLTTSGMNSAKDFPKIVDLRDNCNAVICFAGVVSCFQAFVDYCIRENVDFYELYSNRELPQFMDVLYKSTVIEYAAEGDAGGHITVFPIHDGKPTEEYTFTCCYSIESDEPKVVSSTEYHKSSDFRYVGISPEVGHTLEYMDGFNTCDGSKISFTAEDMVRLTSQSHQNCGGDFLDVFDFKTMQLTRVPN